MPIPSTPALSLCGGHPSLDLVNTLDNRFRASGPDEKLAGYPQLLRFLVDSRLIDTPRAEILGRHVGTAPAEEALRSVRELREAAAAVLYGRVDEHTPAPTAVRTLEKYFLGAAQHRELHCEAAGVSWRWGRFEAQAQLPLWILAQSTMELLLDEARLHRVRACGVDTCRWLFLDTSKNHTRRWCDMRVCGNRMKARRFKEKRDS